MDRREFVVCGGGAALALGAGAWAAAGSRTGTGAGWPPGALPFAAIFDSRFPDSFEFGQSAARFGCELRPIRGDVTELWLRQLRPLWARGEGAIVGMTSAISFLCIQQLASEFWMRVAARVEHIAQADTRVHHRLKMHESIVPQLKAALVDGTPWATKLIGPLVQALGIPPQTRPALTVAITRRTPPMQSKMPLVSWAIATREEVPT